MALGAFFAGRNKLEKYKASPIGDIKSALTYKFERKERFISDICDYPVLDDRFIKCFNSSKEGFLNDLKAIEQVEAIDWLEEVDVNSVLGWMSYGYSLHQERFAGRDNYKLSWILYNKIYIMCDQLLRLHLDKDEYDLNVNFEYYNCWIDLRPNEKFRGYDHHKIKRAPWVHLLT